MCINCTKIYVIHKHDLIDGSCVERYNTHQYNAHILDRYGPKTSILYVCMHVATHTINNSISMNFNEEYVEIILSILILCVASTVHF